MAEYVSEALKSVRAARREIAEQVRELEIEDDRLERAELALMPLAQAEKRAPARPPSSTANAKRAATNGSAKAADNAPKRRGRPKGSKNGAPQGPRLTERVTDALSSGAFTLPELREQLDVKAQGLARVLTLLESRGAVRKDGEKYAKVDAVGA